LHNVTFEFVRYRLAGSQRWRDGLASKFPDDLRNKCAAQELGRLAEDDNVSAETLAAVAPYADSPAFIDAVSLAARDVFFRSKPKTLDDFLKLVLQRMPAVASEAV
jgi:hypothetical protein